MSELVQLLGLGLVCVAVAILLFGFFEVAFIPIGDLRIVDFLFLVYSSLVGFVGLICLTMGDILD